MKAAFVINARNKAKWVGRAVQGALEQTYPCHILLSDQGSDDGTYEAMEAAVEAFKDKMGAEHKVELLRCPLKGDYGMAACNAHIIWLAEQTDAEWIFQCSADDYSLPARVQLCMEAAAKNPCAGVACTMFFSEPEKEVGPQTPVSGFPPKDGYVRAGEGLVKMAYGSTIWRYRRDWLLRVGTAGDCTADVFYGYLAALDQGYYVIANPQHVHVMHKGLDNMGFGGKMRAAEESGDKETIARINELNRFQLLDLYFATAVRQQQLYPMAHAADTNIMIGMILQQAQGWLNERKNLHTMKVTPWTM